MLPAAEDPAVRAWLRELGLTATASARLVGGAISFAEEIAVVDGDERDRTVVLRRIPTSTDFPGHDPAAELVAEADILRRRAGDPLTPDLLDVDVAGTRCGLPAALLSRLPGRPVVAPVDLDAWLDGLVGAVAAVRATPMRADGLPPYRPWFGADDPPPAWSADPSAWTRRRDRLVRALPEGGEPGVVHRDLHPGNVLFDGRRLTGIVDWPHASVGPVEVDVGRCRVEAAMVVGLDAVGGFLPRCAAVGVDPDRYDPAWDAVAALELARVADRVAAGFVELGARRTVDEMCATLDEVVVASDRPAP